MKKDYLLTPGPTPLPPQVMETLARPIIHHRTPQFQAILKEATENLKYVFQTNNDIFIFASSGTGAMEAAVCNFLSPADSAITVEGGKFGERWSELCTAFGIKSIPIKVEWDSSVEPKDIEKLLKSDKNIKAVFTTLCETSTGVNHDIKAIAQVVKNTDAVLVVDAISGLGVLDLQTDNWCVDVVVSGSQKGLMLPPGLSFISVSQKAWKLIETSRCQKYYFSLKAAKKAWDSVDTPFTPAIGLIIALNESLKMIKKEGLANIFAYYKKLAKATREAAKALGLKIYAKEGCSSDALTAIEVPDGIDAEKMVKTMRDTYQVTIAGGQAELKGKVFRIAHMGYINEFDILTAISCLEKVLKEMGYNFQLGQGVAAAQKVINA
ncbi:MAG: alanine--glyoxylate aminotransferase family protein [Candidatus Omnitrophota bacterium]|nr:alanine--glyoxylate aminotransferase family protein [Candidatus Omnitrophota bacterium]